VIALIDYGAGNLSSVRKALTAAGAIVKVPGQPEDLKGAAGVVIPGVGHFGATAALTEPWRQAIARSIDAGTPLLGICLGMQWLFEGSDEAPDVPGLGLFEGRITRIPNQAPDGSRLKVPHVGWNLVTRTAAGQDVPPDDTYYAYFTHGYAAPMTGVCAGITVYGQPFASAVARGWVWGVQFHPEKSGQAGLALLRGFVASAERRATGQAKGGLR
jgi:imidazole glycerol-phosphate synthase subunit HisH